MATDGTQLLQRYQQASQRWDHWKSVYDEAYSYAVPNRNPYNGEERVEGKRKNVQVYDTTLVTAARQLVSKLHANLTPLGEQWFQLEAGRFVTDQNQRQELNQRLQEMTDIILKVLNDSNFDLVINELFQDLIIGTGAMMILENPDSEDVPILFKSVSPNLIAPEANAFDQIETVWRDFQDVHHRDIKRLWPKAEITQLMQQRIDQHQEERFDFVEGVIFQPDEDPSKQYRIVVMEQKQSEMILDMTTESSPWVVARWSKTNKEVGGRGPVIEALPTARSLNKMVEFLLKNASLSVNPPYMAASDGVFNPYLFEIEPNKVIPISRQSMVSGQLPLQKLDTQGQFQFGEAEVNDLRTQIKEMLFSAPERPVQAPSQTATEIMIRQRQFLEEIGPAFGRLEVELLPKIINRVIFILQKKGFLPKDIQIDNKFVNVKFKSPLTRSSELQKVQNLEQMLTFLGNFFGPQMALGAVNMTELPAWLSDKFDVDEDLVRSPQALQELAQQAAQTAQQQNEGPNIPDVGETGPTREAFETQAGRTEPSETGGLGGQG